MVSAQAGAITSSVLLLISEALPFMPTKFSGIVQSIFMFVRDAVNSVPRQPSAPTVQIGQIEDNHPMNQV